MKAKCLHPLTAWQCGYTFCKGDSVISPRLVFSRAEAALYHAACGSDLASHAIDVPCGHCHACLMLKRKDMTTRLVHESSCHSRACFLTLTYNDDFVPTTDDQKLGSSSKFFSRGSHDLPFDSELPHKTLLPADVQKFMKRLRRHLEYVPSKCLVKKLPTGHEIVVDQDGCFVRDHASNLRYFAVGEYGTNTRRPHYHILIFGWCPTDREVFSIRHGNVLYTSNQLIKLWPYGFETVGDVNPNVCKYCARYVTKKFTSSKSLPPYVVPEFTLQSVKNGGIGALWFMQFGEDAVRRGFVTYRNDDKVFKASVPQYYLHLLRRVNLPLWLDVRNERLEFFNAHKGDVPDFDLLKRVCDKDKYTIITLEQQELF